MNVTNFKGELTKLFNSIQKLADESQEKDQIIRNLKNKGNSSNLKVLVNKLFQYIKEINEVFSAEPENRLRMLNVLKEKIDQNRDLLMNAINNNTDKAVINNLTNRNNMANNTNNLTNRNNMANNNTNNLTIRNNMANNTNNLTIRNNMANNNTNNRNNNISNNNSRCLPGNLTCGLDKSPSKLVAKNLRNRISKAYPITEQNAEKIYNNVVLHKVDASPDIYS